MEWFFVVLKTTGLDPTIFFYMNGNRSKDLDTSDAHFVDVIHTGAGILGQWGPNGHADFYVNGGSSQPGCATASILREYSSSLQLVEKKQAFTIIRIVLSLSRI